MTHLATPDKLRNFGEVSDSRSVFIANIFLAGEITKKVPSLSALSSKWVKSVWYFATAAPSVCQVSGKWALACSAQRDRLQVVGKDCILISLYFFIVNQTHLVYWKEYHYHTKRLTLWWNTQILTHVIILGSYSILWKHTFTTEKYKLNEMRRSKVGSEEGGVQQKKKRENLCRNQR